jgi:hypothetical protein
MRHTRGSDPFCSDPHPLLRDGILGGEGQVVARQRRNPPLPDDANAVIPTKHYEIHFASNPARRRKEPDFHTHAQEWCGFSERQQGRAHS